MSGNVGRPRQPYVVAHRGDSLRYRENTLAAIRSAVAAGADRVEIDVVTTRDGVSVVNHDRTLLRLWGRRRRVSSASGHPAVASAGLAASMRKSGTPPTSVSVRESPTVGVSGASSGAMVRI